MESKYKRGVELKEGGEYVGKGGSWGVKNRVEEGEENGEGKRGWGGGVKNEEGEGGKKLMKREKGLRWRRVVGGRVRKEELS